MSAKKIVFVNYLTGERDGVSLEIEKRANVAKKLRCEVYYLTGHDGMNRKNAYIFPDMQLIADITALFRINLFEHKELDDSYLKQLYDQTESKFVEGFTKMMDELKPDLFYVHNLFSHALHLPATTALLKVLDTYKTPVVSVDHDFWFERKKYLTPQLKFVKDILEYIPPERPYIIKHQVINSLSAESLAKRRNMVVERIGDYFNYDEPPPVIDEYNKNLREELGISKNDIVFLQATRITERKAIENAIRFVATFQQKSTAQKVWLLFSNFVEGDSRVYYGNLHQLAKKLHINVLWEHELFQIKRNTVGRKKIYNFWDAYLIADVVTYPSIQEGFGNQFLEAIYFHKPIVMFEYEVYKKDIKPEGYRIISLGDTTEQVENFEFVPQKIIDRAVDETITLLQHPEEIKSITDHNFQTARTYHNETKLVEDMSHIIQTLASA